MARLEGTFVQRHLVTSTVEFAATLQPVANNVWLPVEIAIKGDVQLAWMKRRMEARNVFANYRLNTGLTDSFFQ